MHRDPVSLALNFYAFLITEPNGGVITAIIGFAVVIIQQAFAAWTAKRNRKWDLEDRDLLRQQVAQEAKKITASAVVRSQEIKTAIVENTDLTVKALDMNVKALDAANDVKAGLADAAAAAVLAALPPRKP
jgi:hypothetical protein